MAEPLCLFRADLHPHPRRSRFACSALHPSNFHLDRQTLTVPLAAAGMLEKGVKMISFQGGYGRTSGIAKQFSIPDFDVVSWRAGPLPYAAYEGAPGTAGCQIQIEVQRKLAYFVMKVILPLCLILLMSRAPRWIDPVWVVVRRGDRLCRARLATAGVEEDPAKTGRGADVRGASWLRRAAASAR